MHGCSLMQRRSRSSNLQFRKRVPATLIPIIQTHEITRTLNTAQKSEAKAILLRVGLAVDRLFKEAERIRAAGEPIPPKGWAKEYLERHIAAPLESSLATVAANTIAPASMVPDSPSMTGWLAQVWASTANHVAQFGLPPIVGINPPTRRATLKQLFDAYFGEFPRRGRTEQVARAHLELFNTINNLDMDAEVHTVTSEHVERYIQKLAKLPTRRLGQKFSGLSIDEMIALAVKEKLPLMDVKTRKNRVDTLLAAFNYARRHGYIEVNPFSGKTSKREVKNANTKKSRRLPFDQQELELIFAGEWFKRPPGEWGGKQWLLVIGLYTGARLEEIGQLRVNDVCDIDDIHYFNITESDDPDEVIDGSERPKSLKTTGSERRVPVHPTLIDLGLLDHVSEMRKRGHARVFPDIKSSQESITSAYSKAANRYIDNCGIVSPQKTFHSLRHTFIRQCRDAGIHRDHHQALTGHREENVGDHYGDGFSLSTLNEDIAKVRYGLSWEKP